MRLSAISRLRALNNPDKIEIGMKARTVPRLVIIFGESQGELG